MWPINSPAARLLRLPGAAWISWAIFDVDWYRTTYARAVGHLVNASDEAILRFYLETGQGIGHSPNMLFDEAWHRRAYPEMAALVQTGQFASAFDAYCRGGHNRSPHWLFDEARYCRNYPDLTDAALAERGLVNGYDHYLWRGDAEGRDGHPLFDPALYLARLEPEAANAARAEGPFRHCLRRIDRSEPEVRTCARFDPVWYRGRYQVVRQAIDDGIWRWALEHYLQNDTPTQFDPVSAFSESYYLARYDDAAGMVDRGEIRNAFAHFVRHGVAEGRSPSESINISRYAARDDVRRDIDHGLAADAFVHWLTIGEPSHSAPAPRREEAVTEAQASTWLRRRARTLSVVHARTPLNFQIAGEPGLSVIMVLRDQFELTMTALGSLRANHPGEIELILIDCGSTDETCYIQRYVHGAVHFRFDTDIGSLPARNAALQFATGEVVLYLDSEIEPAPGSVAAASRRLESDPRIGAVGGMILGMDGLVREAGNIIWRDGSVQSYGRESSPLAPEVNFTREVEFCSCTFLLARRSLLMRLEGFDAELTPGGYEVADLCLRMRQAGYTVVYDPAVVVYHVEHDSTLKSLAPTGMTGCDPGIFTARHAAYLAGRPLRDKRREVFARVTDTSRRRVLFVEDSIPLRMIGSGYVRSNDIVREMAALGYIVTVYPINGSRFDVASVYAEMPDGVEVMHDRAREQFLDFLTERNDYYDVIWVARTHNLAAVLATLKRALPDWLVNRQVPRLMLDTEAIEAVRDSGRAALEGRPFNFDAAVGSELLEGSFCQTIVAINGVEAEILRGLEFRDVAVIGHMRVPSPTGRPFAQRAGMLFVGAIHRMDSPNYNSLCWFIDEVLPLIARELAWETRLTVVGYTGADVDLGRFRDHPRVTLHGAISDLQPLYDQHRVFIAPTRFAAGTPYKVHEAASFGLPVVATELLRRQLGWENGRDLLAADASEPAAFACHVVAAQRDEVLWTRLREAALDRIRLENNREDYAAAIRGVLGPPLSRA